MKTFINSIWGGIMISIGAMIYLNCPNKVVGAFLFSIGLITIMIFKFKLYTGEIGYIRRLSEIPYILTVLIGNFIGCASILMIPTNNAEEIVVNKLSYCLPYTFGKSVIRGILIYVCVATYRATKNWYIVLIGVPTFILCGAEHSIADLCFIFAAREFTLNALIFIMVVVIGNAVGSLCISLCTQYTKQND